ncbi:MAG: putative lipid II flippase FtsW [Gammaproteobacteria bacterium]|nr:MAG: putative lipid II flippase FtsW [Gammaproteobacteria bacterium]
MSVPTATLSTGTGRRQAVPPRALGPAVDPWLLLAAGALAALGLVMVASASFTVAERRFGEPFRYLEAQALYLALGALLGGALWRWVPLALLRRLAPLALAAGLLLLGLVLLPGLGREANGAARWLALGPVRVQASEPAKLALLLFLAAHLAGRGPVRGLGEALPALALTGLAAGLLLLEPDFGGAVVLGATALALLFLAGLPWRHLLLLVAAGGAGAAALVWSSPYRLQRVLAFLDPWADPFASGFQLTQALIAFGRGEWLGVGLGGSVQKLFYLPEAHTDFLYAVLGEELGAVGALAVIGLYGLLVLRAFRIGARAEAAGLPFGAFLAWGVGTALGLQAAINLGVNLGLLPTKGLTLPLMSYGGSSLVATCLALGLLARVDREARFPRERGGRGR